MKAKIIGEDKKDIGVKVFDNAGVEHQIEMQKSDGEIYAHDQDGFPDKADHRSNEGNEYVNQARRFAQYCVYTECGYDTVPPRIHPERINAVRLVVSSLSESQFEQHFGDLYQQLRSHDDSTVNSVIEVPSVASDLDSVLYRKNVYLGVDLLETDVSEEAQALADQYGLDLTESLMETRPSAEHLTTVDFEAWQSFAEELAVDHNEDLSEGLQLGGVSSLHLAYIDDAGEEHVTSSQEPFDHAPDVRIELPVMDAGTLNEFQAYLNHNLACQIRDCFIRMGLEPPEPFQVLGYGDYESAEQYRHLEMYPNYVDPEEQQAFI